MMLCRLTPVSRSRTSSGISLAAMVFLKRSEIGDLFCVRHDLTFVSGQLLG